MQNKIKINRTEESIALIKALASRDRTEAYEAQMALAAFVGPLVSEFIAKARTLSSLFTTLEYDAFDSPSIPVDLYYDITAEKEVQVWSQTTANGLATNFMQPVESDMKFHTQTLDSAWHFDNKNVRAGRADVVGKTLTKIMQAIMILQDRYSAQLILGTIKDTAGTNTVASAAAAGNVVQPQDINALQTLAKRLNTAWNGGTPANGRGGPTDLILSPEVMEQIRAMAYNPVNNLGANGSTGTAASGVISAPDSLRDQVWGGGGIASFWGLGLMEILELGPSQVYTDIFQTIASSGPLSPAFATGDDIIIGIDRSKEALLRAVSLDEDTGAQFTIEPDDQFASRLKKTGFIGSVEEGRMVIDANALTAIIVR
jgi:hypothetical protein